MLDSSEPRPSRLPGPVPRSAAQAAASRANAKGSTGPRTRLGKLRIRHNGVRHGLYAATAPMIGERRRDFRLLAGQFAEEFTPQSAYEDMLVHRAATLVWRLGRVPAAENALFESFGAEAAGMLAATGGDDDAPDEDAAAPDVGVDLLWGLSFRSGLADSPVNRLARWERGLHRQLREVMAELRRCQADRRAQGDESRGFRDPELDYAEAYTALDNHLAWTDNCFTRQELEDEVVRLRALLAARDGLPPPVTPVHARGQMPLRRMEEIQAHAFTGHTRGLRVDDLWTPAAEEVARIQALADRADEIVPFRPDRRADAPRDDDAPINAWPQGTPFYVAGDQAARHAQPRIFGRDPSPDEAARGLPERPRDPRAATAITDRPKMPSR